MKKIFSLLLCILIVFSLMPVASYSASQYDGYIELKENKLNEVLLSENHGYEYFVFTPEVTALYNIYSFDSTDTFIYAYDENMNEIAYDDDSGVNTNFSVFLSLEKGKTYSFVVSAYFDVNAYFDICIENISALEIEQLRLGEKHSVTINPNTRRKFFSFTPQTTGYYAFESDYFDQYPYLPENPYVLWYDSHWNALDKDDDSGEDLNCSLACYLTAGQTYYFEATRFYGTWEISYDVTIKETTVAVKTEIIKEPDNISYFADKVEEDIDYSGLELELTYSDGEKLIWKYDEHKDIVGTSIDIMLLKDDAGKYYIYIIAGFSDCSLYLDVSDKKVENISVYSMPELELYENISGYENTSNYDFIYTYEIPKDTMMQIDYSDGTSEIVNYYDKVNNSSFNCKDNQLSGQLWSLGKNPITIEFCSKQTTIYANVVENPVEKITLNTAPTRKYVYGNEAYGKLHSGTYELCPYDFTGLSFNVHYKNGKVRTYTDSDIRNGKIDGYEIYFDSIEISKGGTYQASFRYFEKECQFDVFVYDKIEPKGDIDMDGAITVVDATLIQLHLADLVTLNEAQIFACKVYDYAPTTTILDVLHLQSYIAKLIPEL